MKQKKVSYPSIKAFAGAIGAPVASVRQLKHDGCPGFDSNGRIYPMEVIGWLLSKGKQFKPELSLESARAKLANVRADQILREADKHDGSMSSVTDQARALELIVNFFNNSLVNLCYKIAYQINPADTEPTKAALINTLQTLLQNAAAHGIAWHPELPAWAISAIHNGVSGSMTQCPRKEFDTEIQLWMKFIAECRSEGFRQSLDAFIAQREAKRQAEGPPEEAK